MPELDYTNAVQTGLMSQSWLHKQVWWTEKKKDVRTLTPTMFGQQSHVAGVGTPHHVLDLGNLNGGQRAFLLHVKQCDAICIAQQQ